MYVVLLESATVVVAEASAIGERIAVVAKDHPFPILHAAARARKSSPQSGVGMSGMTQGQKSEIEGGICNGSMIVPSFLVFAVCHPKCERP